MSVSRNLKRRALTRRYLSLRRAFGHRASVALHYAKQPQIKPLEWNANVDRAEWHQAGFRLVARIETDNDPDYSYLGEFTTKWKRGAIKVDPSEAGDSRIYPSRRGEDVYYVPCNSYREHRKGLRALGYGKHAAHTLARSYVLQDMKRLRALNMQEWQYVGVVVTAYRNGIKLGQESLWGIESYGRNTPTFPPHETSEAYCTETARDLASEAISEAERALESLCVRRARA